MSRFLTGDELGNIKTLRHGPSDVPGEPKTESTTIHQGPLDGTTNAIQRLSIASTSVQGTKLLAAARADGSVSAFNLTSEDALEVVQEYKEPRFRAGQSFVGLKVSESTGIYSCTSNGGLRLTTQPKEGLPSTSHAASLPIRLCDWRLSSDEQTFAYGGDEVELSVWDTEKAFAVPSKQGAPASDARKRKRGDELFPGEVWRAKNVRNDFLGLRQPVRITSLTYLSPSPSASQHHLLTGTQLGDVRRYDTRAARRPVADWQGVGKLGGVKVVEKGLGEHELFVGDHGCNLFAMDLRNGRVVYNYKGMSGAITSIAPSPSLLASTALDRFSRVHSTFLPPKEVGQHQDKKGAVLAKVFVKSIPTTVIWDGEVPVEEVKGVVDPADDVWNEIEDVVGGDEDDSEDEQDDTAPKRRQKKSKAL